MQKDCKNHGSWVTSRKQCFLGIARQLHICAHSTCDSMPETQENPSSEKRRCMGVVVLMLRSCFPVGFWSVSKDARGQLLEGGKEAGLLGSRRQAKGCRKRKGDFHQASQGEKVTDCVRSQVEWPWAASPGRRLETQLSRGWFWVAEQGGNWATEVEGGCRVLS